MNDRYANLTEKVKEAFKAVSRDVIERAKQTKTSVIIWEEEQVKEIPWHQLDQRFPEYASPEELPPGE